MSNLKEEFWDRLPDVRACMLGFEGDPLVPMSPRITEGAPGKIWFITAEGTTLALRAQAGDAPARLVASDESAGLYADVLGTLSLVRNSGHLDDVWSFVASAWFEEGRSDPDVRLLSFEPVKGEVTVTSNGAKVLYEFAKATITGDHPDVGQKGSVAF